MASQKKFGTFSGVLTPSLLTILGVIMYMRLGSVVGNSSSGISEAPSFKIASINIGDRQKGRVFANSIINCKISTTEETSYSLY